MIVFELCKNCQIRLSKALFGEVAVLYEPVLVSDSTTKICAYIVYRMNSEDIKGKSFVIVCPDSTVLYCKRLKKLF